MNYKLDIGNVVECRDGQFGVYFGTHIGYINRTQDMNDFDDDLKWIHGDFADIVAVYIIHGACSLEDISEGEGINLKFKVKEKPLVLTHTELEKMLCRDIKIISE